MNIRNTFTQSISAVNIIYVKCLIADALRPGFRLYKGTKLLEAGKRRANSTRWQTLFGVEKTVAGAIDLNNDAGVLIGAGGGRWRPGLPPPGVQRVLMQQREKRHSSVIHARPDPTHRARETVVLQRSSVLLGPEQLPPSVLNRFRFNTDSLE